jgi:hypothetical protein
VNLDVKYNSTFAKVRINLIALDKELKLPSFLNFDVLKNLQGEPKPQGAKQLPDNILDLVNKILEVLINEFIYSFPPCREVDHKINVVRGLALPSKAPYRLNKKEFKKPQKN